MRTEENRKCVLSGAGALTDDVANGVDAHGESRLAHHVHREPSSRDVRVGERDAADAALRVCAETGQIGQVLVDARAIDAPVFPVRPRRSCLRAQGDAGDGGGRRLQEVTPAHGAHSLARLENSHIPIMVFCLIGYPSSRACSTI